LTVKQSQTSRVLVVEDDQVVRSLLVEIVEDEGYIAIPVSNGREALSHLVNTGSRPNLILLDLNMPVMSGWEFRAAQRADPSLADIPVVVLSADRSLQQGTPTVDAVAYLPKPIDFQKLLELIEQFCG
jgi:CheY-like chemotaxis protein